MHNASTIDVLRPENKRQTPIESTLDNKHSDGTTMTE